MRPVPGVVSAVVSVQSVYSGLLKETDNGNALLKAAAVFHIVLAREDALVDAGSFARRAVAHEHGVVRAAGLLDAADHVGGNAQTVLQAAAVFVGAEIEVRHGELVKQIALVNGMDLHAVTAGFLRERRAVYHDIDQLVYLILGQGAMLHLRGKDVRHAVARRDHRPLIIEIWKGDAEVRTQAAAHAGAELKNELGISLLVQLAHEILQRAAEYIDRFVQPAGPAPLVSQYGQTGDNEPNAVLGAVHEELNAVAVEFIVDDRRRAAHRTENYPVRDLELPDLEGSKQGRVFG